jgi:uncharacterized protein YxjI
MEEYINTVGKYAKGISLPKNKIVITDERFCFDETIVFKLNEKFWSISHDDFTIKDINGVKYFKCEGKFLSLRDRKILYDLYNQPILNMLDKLFSLRGKMNIYEGDSQEKSLLQVKPKSPIFNKKFTINFFNKKTNQNELIEMHCDFLAFKCEIYYGKKNEGAPMIAKIVQNIKLKTVITECNSYFVEVAAGVDTAIIVALAICFDENRSEVTYTDGLTTILDIFT